jgi:transposase-like protein
MEVPQRASRQAHFTPLEKWTMLLEYDKCLDRGSKTAFYRHMGVSKTTVHHWVKAREEGRLRGPDKGEPARSEQSSLSIKERRRLALLERENEALKLKLEQSAATVDILKKASALLDSLAKSATMPKIENVPEEVEGWPAWLKPKNGEKS